MHKYRSDASMLQHHGDYHATSLPILSCLSCVRVDMVPLLLQLTSPCSVSVAFSCPSLGVWGTEGAKVPW